MAPLGLLTGSEGLGGTVAGSASSSVCWLYSSMSTATSSSSSSDWSAVSVVATVEAAGSKRDADKQTNK